MTDSHKRVHTAPVTVERNRNRPAAADFSSRSLPAGEWATYRRRILEVSAVRIPHPFTVQTREGTIGCDDGWLALDINGDPYPIADDVFRATYAADTPTRFVHP